MANLASSQFEAAMKSAMVEMASVVKEAADLYKFYFSSDATAKVDALPNADDAATVSTGLTKANFYFFVGTITEIGHWVNNAAVAQGAYLDGCEAVLEKVKVADAKLSDATEAAGERIKALGRRLVNLYGTAVQLSKQYDAIELGAVASALDDGSVVFGCDSTAGKFIAGATVMVQFENLMSNQAVVQGDYLSSILKWI